MIIFQSLLFLCVNYIVLGELSKKKWWYENIIIYEIYPRSFMDLDGDGVGDINGITSKLDYLKELGVDCLYIRYLYQTSDHDSDTYEITNHTAIDPLIGTMDDLDKLIKELHNKGMKLIIDFIPNHTSMEHDWFQKSQNNDATYFDYYVWKKPKGYGKHGEPKGPNNWQSLNGYYGWHFSDSRKQFYYHLYSHKQPDLNLRNEKVVEEFKKILTFWLRKGIDGIVIKSADYLIEDMSFNDNQYVGDKLKFNYAKNNEESYKFIRQMIDITRKFANDDGYDRLVIAETEGSTTKSIYEKNYQIGHIGLNGKVLSQHIRQAGDSSAGDLSGRIIKYYKNKASDIVLWTTELHNERRIPSIYGDESVDIVNALALLLPGVGYTYYGQEIGLKGVHDNNWDKYSMHLGISKEDSNARYTERVPMSWTDTINAGFTTAEKPWYPVSPDYWKLNVESQKAENNSHLNFYKTLVKLKKDTKYAVSSSNLWPESNDILYFLRGKYFYVFINLGNETVDCRTQGFKFRPAMKYALQVIKGSTNAIQKPGEIIKINSDGEYDMTFRPRSVVIFKIIEDKN